MDINSLMHYWPNSSTSPPGKLIGESSHKSCYNTILWEIWRGGSQGFVAIESTWSELMARWKFSGWNGHEHKSPHLCKGCSTSNNTWDTLYEVVHTHWVILQEYHLLLDKQSWKLLAMITSRKHTGWPSPNHNTSILHISRTITSMKLKEKSDKVKNFKITGLKIWFNQECN